MIRFRNAAAAPAAVLSLFCLRPAAAQTQLIMNGNFEAGGNFTSTTTAGAATYPTADTVPFWDVVNQNGNYVQATNPNGSAGNFFTDLPGSSTPANNVNANPSAGVNDNPIYGSLYAVSDIADKANVPGQQRGGAHAIYQRFTVPARASSLTLEFRMFVNTLFDVSRDSTQTTLNYLTPNDNQYGRVDILAANANLFTIANNTPTVPGVLRTLYYGGDGTSQNGLPFRLFNTATAADATNFVQGSNFNLTSLLGQSDTPTEYILRFAVVANRQTINMGVDNVSIAFAAIPEPGSLLLMLSGAVMVAGAGRIRKRRRAHDA